MKIIRSISKAVLHLHFLLFAIGFLIAGYLFCGFQADYENRLFASFANEISAGEQQATQDSLLKKAVHATYALLHERSKVFYCRHTGGFLDDIIHPLSADMLTADGACGSYSAVLCRVLNTMGFTTRFAQMKVNGKYGGHIIAEAKTADGWVALDPIFNMYFTKPGGRLAAFNEVAANWDTYKQQVPAGYNMQYNYQGVRYTNWNKLPVLMPLLKKTMSLFTGRKEIDQISLRTYFLNKYAVCGNILLCLMAPLLLLVIVKLKLLSPLATLQFRFLQSSTGNTGTGSVNA